MGDHENQTNIRDCPPRLWPAVGLLSLLWALRWIPSLVPEQTVATRVVGFLGPVVCIGLLLAWWLVWSRVPLRERLFGVAGLALIVALTTALSDESMRFGHGFLAGALPWGVTAFTVGFIAARRRRGHVRVGLALLVALLAFGGWALVRSDGVWGDFSSQYHWRWEPLPEERILADLERRDRAAIAAGAKHDSLIDVGWPGFRGPGRDAVVPGIVLDPDWDQRPPRELWRIPVGPGWSSFAAADGRLFTQEQRGDDEVVVSYDAATGAELWSHAYPSRFREAQGGVGPRATPTLSVEGLFALGAEGLLHRLDPATGEMVWRADLRFDADREPPIWGFSSSPLVVDDLVIVHAGGGGDRGVLAYDVENGRLRWSAATGGHSYSSPQLLTLAGMRTVVMVTDVGLTLIDPVDGSLHGSHDWEGEYRVLQPLRLSESSLLISSRFDGIRRLNLEREGDRLVAVEQWTSRAMKSDFNDYVAHQGHLYGFDVNIFACVDLETGERRWKRGRYGHGQVLLLPDGEQLLVAAETGELVLLRANPERFDELARIDVLQGKTWNHPVLVGPRLYLRNSEEAVGLELPVR